MTQIAQVKKDCYHDPKHQYGSTRIQKIRSLQAGSDFPKNQKWEADDCRASNFRPVHV
jgi:hypothetical protein